MFVLTASFRTDSPNTSAYRFTSVPSSWWYTRSILESYILVRYLIWIQIYMDTNLRLLNASRKVEGHVFRALIFGQKLNEHKRHVVEE